MQLVLIIGLFVIAAIGYVVSRFTLSRIAVKKLWVALMLVLFIGTIGIMLIVHFNTNLLGTFKEMTELYIAYFAVILLLAVGLINIWIFKGPIWRVLTGKSIDHNLK